MFKFGAFDPWGKQNNFAETPRYMSVLFNLSSDGYELHNIFNETKTTNPSFVARLEKMLQAYSNCTGAECRDAGMV